MGFIITFLKMMLFTIKYYFATIFWAIFAGTAFSSQSSLGFVILLVYIFSGFLLSFVFRRKLFFFPVWKLITARSPIGHFDDSEALPLREYRERKVNLRARRKTLHEELKASSSIDSLVEKRDFNSGYDASALASVSFVNSPIQSGTPGRGDVSITSKYFAKAVSKAGFSEELPFVWSVKTPELATLSPASDLRETVDVVLPTRDTLYLVKFVEVLGQNAIYSMGEDGDIVARDADSGKDLNTPIKTSELLAGSVERFKAHFKTLKVVGVVVAIGKNGESKFEKVIWPGGIKVRSLSDFLSELDFIASREPEEMGELVGKLAPLVS